ncbi:MAG: hypothetical protein HY297_01310 [Thaumarchaeota archaeon]|nr:hypothetical protein [Nitrososphaerota archaeon]
MRSNQLVAIAVAALVVGAVGVYYWNVGGLWNNTTSTTPEPVSKQFYMEVAGSLYLAVDVTEDTVFRAPGYSYFQNNSVTFLGVKFQPICPATVIGCPNPSGGTQTNANLSVALIQVRLTFPDTHQEIVSEAIGRLNYAPVVSNHLSPRAGVLVEYIPKTSSYKIFLLVTPYTMSGGV